VRFLGETAVNKNTKATYTLRRRKWLIIEVKCWAYSVNRDEMQRYQGWIWFHLSLLPMFCTTILVCRRRLRQDLDWLLIWLCRQQNHRLNKKLGQRCRVWKIKYRYLYNILIKWIYNKQTSGRIINNFKLWVNIIDCNQLNKY